MRLPWTKLRSFHGRAESFFDRSALFIVVLWNPRRLLNIAGMVNSSDAEQPDRREFLKKACAAGIGTALVLVPLGAGTVVLTDPWRRKAEGSSKVFVTSLESLPNDGIPRKFSVIAGRVDAWNKFPNSPIGAVYLRRTGEHQVEALNVVCPHAGCFVDFRSEKSVFYCPCHNSSFDLKGQIADKKSPAPRAMDALDVEVKDGKEIWVTFQNYETGRAQKIPIA
jgi:menaquinol-cytochrome c reductase iron-sulfur subunit